MHNTTHQTHNHCPQKQQGIVLITALALLTLVSIITINSLQNNRLAQIIHNKISQYQTSLMIANSGLKLATKSFNNNLEKNLCELTENASSCQSAGNPQVFVYLKPNTQPNEEYLNIYQIISTGETGNTSITLMQRFIIQNNNDLQRLRHPI